MCLGAFVIALMCFSPPEMGPGRGANMHNVDMPRFAGQVLGVAVLTGVVVVTLASRKRKQDGLE